MKQIRRCAEGELSTLQAIAHETYDETFRSMNSAETMDRYLQEAFNTERLLGELRNPDSEFYFLEADDCLVG